MTRPAGAPDAPEPARSVGLQDLLEFLVALAHLRAYGTVSLTVREGQIALVRWDASYRPAELAAFTAMVRRGRALPTYPPTDREDA